MNFDIIILTSKLNELTRFVMPVLYQFRRITPQVRLIMMLLPSNDNSMVLPLVNKLEGVSLVLNPEETRAFLTKGRFPLNLPLNKQGAIISLTNNYIFAINFSWRTNFPIFAYINKYTFWHRWIHKIFLPNEMIYAQYRLKKISPYKLEMVGDLWQDAVKSSLLPLEARLQFRLNPKMPVMALIPDNNKNIIPTYFKIAEEIHAKYPHLQFIMPLTPFIGQHEFLNQNVVNEDGYYYIKLKDCSIQIIQQTTERYDAYQVADIALTSSSVITEELTTLGVPMIFASSVAQNQKNNDKFANIPIIGKYLKQNINNQTDFISFPNIKAQQMIVPEYNDLDITKNGNAQVENIINTSIELLNSPDIRRAMTIKLREFAKPSGAAERMVKSLIQELKTIYSSPHNQYSKNKKELKGEKLN